MLELRDRGSAEGWLASGLCLMRLARPSAEALGATAPWVVSTLSETSVLPPAGVVADVGRLALGATLHGSSAGPPPSSDLRLRAALSSYEDQLLGRLAADPRIDAVCDAVRRLPASLRDPAIALLVAHLLERVGYDAGVAISTGVARRVVQRPADELIEEGFIHLGRGGELAALLAHGYEALAAAARHTGTLLAESVVFALENMAVLASLSQRLAIQQIVEVSEELEKVLPRRLKRRRASRGRTPTRVEDESVYPIGGFSSISTMGSLENLVSSELIYMDQGTARGEVDIFDVRYAEGELLYYTRDESVFVRNRRVLSFALLPDLTCARFKDEAVRWQRLVCALGLVLCSVRRLSDWLSEEDLLFRLVFVKDAAGTTPLAPELALARLLLGEWLEKGNAEVVEAASLEEAHAAAVEHTRRAESDLIVISTSSPVLTPHPRARIAELSLEAPVPALRWLDGKARGPEARDEPPAPWQGWTELALALLRELV